eukprot:Seg557.5 transcript_id=Seg557.5/GoldUCD/mRNA.D3Y31 product="General transcription factor 3C polypeptide 6" protein_id=Seg557.5/GoldUCD/D3Y31
MAGTSEEWEEEEQIVLVELQGLLDTDDLKYCTTDNSFFWGTATENPVLKLNRYIFSGEYDDTIGTAVFFEETEKDAHKHLKYKCHTTRKLETVRSCLEPKEGSPQADSQNSASSDVKNAEEPSEKADEVEEESMQTGE